jgi:hypothetical protein
MESDGTESTQPSFLENLISTFPSLIQAIQQGGPKAELAIETNSLFRHMKSMSSVAQIT